MIVFLPSQKVGYWVTNIVVIKWMKKLSKSGKRTSIFWRLL